MKKLQDRARVKAWLSPHPYRRFMYGTLCTLRGTYAESGYWRDRCSYEEFVAEQMRRGQGSEVWGNQDPICVVASKAMQEKFHQRRAECIELKHGEEIEVDGEVWVVKITGDYSNFIQCERKSSVKTAA